MPVNKLSSANPFQIIFDQRHPTLDLKDHPSDSIWQLIYDSYVGGLQYLSGDHLIKYPKESQNNFGQRKHRCAYFNQISPLVDMLSGMLFLNEPKRKIPPLMEYFSKAISRDKKLNEFSRILAAHSLMFTIGVLVDLPSFNPEEIQNEKDRQAKNIYPYAVMYLPFKIRDFYVGDNGVLEWVLLDNSYYSHEDPLVAGKEIAEYRLWTKTYFQDFTKEDDIITDSEQQPHNLGRVPFRFINWRDDNNDFIGETIFEDIAAISKLIYNSMSYLDEMLASGAFKMLSYPSKDGTLPPEITQGGLGPLSAIPYDMASSNKPEFIGATLGDVDAFIKAMGIYMSEILKKVGLNTDETKEFVKSGAAKKIDFQKMRSLLQAGALTMAKTEEWMFETASLWMKGKETITSEYTSDFSSEELNQEVQMLEELLIHPVTLLRQTILQVLVKKLLSNNVDAETIEKINKAIETDITKLAVSSETIGNVNLAAAEGVFAKQSGIPQTPGETPGTKQSQSQAQ